MPIFDKRNVVTYFAQCRGGGTGLLDIRRPGLVSALNRTKKARANAPIPIPGIVGSYFPVTGDAQQFEDEGSMRIADVQIFARDHVLQVADTQTDMPGDLLYVIKAERGRLRVTDDADGLYTVSALGVDYSYPASGDTVDTIRDGLVAAIGSPALFAVAPTGTDQIIFQGVNAGERLQVSTTPASLIYQVEDFAHDIYEIYRRGNWVDGQFGEYVAKYHRERSGA